MSTPIREWALATVPGDNMLWKGGWGSQIMFFRDELRYLMASGLDWDEAEGLGQVISTHTSKSISLPVVEYARPDIGLRLILRDNFHDVKLSVISRKPITTSFDGLFHTTPPVEPDYTGNELADCYFEGFPDDLIFGYLSESDGRRWSAAIGGRPRVWTTIFLILRELGAVKAHVWNTKETHRAALDAEATRRKARATHTKGLTRP